MSVVSFPKGGDSIPSTERRAPIEAARVPAQGSVANPGGAGGMLNAPSAADGPAAGAAEKPSNALERILIYASEQLGRPSSLAVLRAALPDTARQVEAQHLPSLFAQLGIAAREISLARADLDLSSLPVLVLADDGRATVITEVVDAAKVLVASADAKESAPPKPVPMSRRDLTAVTGCTAYALRAAAPDATRQPGWRERHAWLVEPLAENWWFRLSGPDGQGARGGLVHHRARGAGRNSGAYWFRQEQRAAAHHGAA